LQNSANEIYTSLKSNETINDNGISAILIKDNNIIPLTHGRMGLMPYLASNSNNNFETKGIFKNGMNAEFLYYNLKTDLGNIIVFQSNMYSSEYLRIVYIILFFIFVFAVLLSIPLISYVGKKFTRPILKLQKAASSISKGNFDIDCKINTKDEIQVLSDSLNSMALDLKKKYQIQKDFIANVSHDFKTPLSVIRSYSEAINDALVDKDTTKAYSGEIIKEVDRLNSLVTDILQLSKLQDSAFSLNKQYINLPDLIEKSVNHFKPLLDKRNISIETSIESLEVYADQKQLQRVLYNLIDNAVKFSNENNKIKIVTSNRNDYIKLSVKDYGIGIEQNLLENILLV
jgi:signal transduction histidine kinase